MPAALPLQTTHWEIPTAVNVSALALSESSTNQSIRAAQPAYNSAQRFIMAATLLACNCNSLSAARVSFYLSYLCLFLLLCKNTLGPDRVVSVPTQSLWITPGPTTESMLAWSTHCDEVRVRVKRFNHSPFKHLGASLSHQRVRLSLGHWEFVSFSVGCRPLQWGLSCGNKGSRKLYRFLFGA